MPGLNGYDTCAQLRGSPQSRNAVIIALTGWGQSDDRRRTHDAGFDAHLVKPVEPASVIRLLERLRPGARDTGISPNAWSLVAGDRSSPPATF
jgi:CheY-like chemotaxis protein